MRPNLQRAPLHPLKTALFMIRSCPYLQLGTQWEAYYADYQECSLRDARSGD
jgi:hypothetical protein